MQKAFTLFDCAFVGRLRGASLGPAVTAKLAAHWPLDETSGDRVDAVGSLDLSPQATVAYAEGKFGNALSLAHTGALQAASDPLMAPASGQSAAYCFWFKPTTTVDGYPLSKADPGPTGAAQSLFHIFWSGTTAGNFTLKVHTSDSASVTINSPNNVPYQQWHFVVCNLGANGNKLSVNGEDFVTSGPALVNAYANHSPVPLVVGGRYSGAASYETTGLIDALTLFNDSLTIDEVRWLYRNAAGRLFPYS